MIPRLGDGNQNLSQDPESDCCLENDSPSRGRKRDKGTNKIIYDIAV